jgi:hypothetical protein
VFQLDAGLEAKRQNVMFSKAGIEGSERERLELLVF